MADPAQIQGSKEIQPEVECLESGQSYEAGFRFCPKKAHHDKYILANDVDMKNLPSDIQFPTVYDLVSVIIKLTGMLTFTQENGAQSFGTGFVQKVRKSENKPCPCRECRSKQIRSWAWLDVSTNLHVVQNQKFAQNCEVSLFFDCDTKENVKILHGLELHSKDKVGDWCTVTCVTHDLDLIKNLEVWIGQYYDLGGSLQQNYGQSDQNNVVIVSHPHGGPKRVSFGKVVRRKVDREVRDGQDWCSYSYDAMTCKGSSGALVYVVGRWRKGHGYWFGHPHNHKGVTGATRFGYSSIGIEDNIDSCSTPQQSHLGQDKGQGNKMQCRR